ncbi:MAG: class I SAM-dependent methyltransferase [Synechococcus sp.]
MTQNRNQPFARFLEMLGFKNESSSPSDLSPRCNICGNSKFGYGPGGRLSSSGKLPQCSSCQSLERHRVIRNLFTQLQAFGLSKLSALQISRDPSVKPDWFGKHEISIYGGQNSIDLENIERADSAYDVVICNHVLEHINDDRQALRELFRIVSDRGFVFLSVPNPHQRSKTTDWGYPDEKQHGHYRLYGIDIIDLLKAELPNAALLTCIGNDPATGIDDRAFLLCKSQTVANHLADLLDTCEHLQQAA